MTAATAAVELLAGFSTCDIADAATKLSLTVHIPNMCMRSPAPFSPSTATTRISGPAHTVQFVRASDTNAPRRPAGSPHHVDIAASGSVIVISTPRDTPNAVWGGLMSARANHVGCQGVVVDGRVRDMREHWDIGIPVFSSCGQSTMGAGPLTRVASVGEPITLGEDAGYPVVVRQGDMIVADVDGVVCIPAEKCADVARVAAEGVAIDARCMKDIREGRGIGETFAEHRGKNKPAEVRA
ncbi:RraA-like protein [Geranomyces variabilis]|nr:RraA-like protein [Geranomyces variabilis]KAJ3140948.1 hypothetical protein HDU90_006967 [Geranomyces variabilis]